MGEKEETLELKLQCVKEKNRTLRVMLETLSSQCQRLESYLQDINNAKQVGTKSDQRGSVLARPEFSIAQKPSHIFVKTHPKDNSLIVKDGYQWKKYGQKKVTKENPYVKCYLAPSCPVKKRVQRSIRDRSILVATYDGKHKHGVFRDLLKPSSSTAETSRMANNLPMAVMPNDKATMNINLCRCNRPQTDIRTCDCAKQQNHRGSNSNSNSNSKTKEYVSSVVRDPDFIIQLAETIVHSITSRVSK